MSTTGMIVSIVLVALALFFVLWPFLRRGGTDAAEAARLRKAHDELLTSYERVLSSIRDLDEDFQIGKLDEETYQRERGFWTERGVALLKEIEADIARSGGPRRKMASSDGKADQALDSAIEEAILAYRSSVKN